MDDVGEFLVDVIDDMGEFADQVWQDIEAAIEDITEWGEDLG